MDVEYTIEPLRHHIDNVLDEDASYEDVCRCISFMREVRKGIDPSNIEGLIIFMHKQPLKVIARFVSKGYNIQKSI